MNKKIIGAVVIVIAIMGAIVLFKNISTSDSVQMAEAQTIKIGVMLPLTGQFSTIGEGIGKAVEIAVKDFEAAHPNVDIITVQEDDKFEAKTGVGIYTKMTTLDNIDGLFMVSTPVVDAANEKMKSDGLPIVVVGLQNYGVGKDNIFQMSADANGQIVNLAKYMNEKSNHQKVALVHSSNAPALEGFYKAFIDTYSKNRVDFVINNKDDAKTVALKIKQEGVDAVVVLTDPSNGSEITKNLLQLGVTSDTVQYYFDAQLQTGWGEYEKQLVDMNKLNGTLVLQFTTSDLSEFKKKFMDAYEVEPSPFAEYGYDGIMTLLNSYDTDKTTWVANISSSDFKGYSGNVDFDERGIRNQGTEVWKVQNGVVVK